MPGLFTLDINRSITREVFDDISESLRKATARTLNKVGRLANREAGTHIKQNFNIKQRDLRQNHRVFLRTADARRFDKFRFVIFVKDVPRGLMKYDPLPTTGGTTVRIGKKRGLIRDAFVSTWRQGQTVQFVFKRDRTLGTYVRRGKRQKARRMKRKVLFGPSIARLYDRKPTLKVITDTVEKNFEKILSEEFDKQFK